MNLSQKSHSMHLYFKHKYVKAADLKASGPRGLGVTVYELGSQGTWTPAQSLYLTNDTTDSLGQKLFRGGRQRRWGWEGHQEGELGCNTAWHLGGPAGDPTGWSAGGATGWRGADRSPQSQGGKKHCHPPQALWGGPACPHLCTSTCPDGSPPVVTFVPRCLLFLSSSRTSTPAGVLQAACGPTLSVG